MNSCPLCGSDQNQLIDKDQLRSFYLCATCQLVFVPRRELISTTEEKKRYECHENVETDVRYREYLSKIVTDCMPFLQKGEVGLDFGCGAAPLLAKIFAEKGLPTAHYDLFFWPNTSALEKRYDFVVMSEVIEHVRDLKGTMQTVASLLSPGGRLFIKTKFYPEPSTFPQWFYKRDPTHIQFFNAASFEQLARELKLLNGQNIGHDLYLLRKS